MKLYSVSGDVEGMKVCPIGKSDSSHDHEWVVVGGIEKCRFCGLYAHKGEYFLERGNELFLQEDSIPEPGCYIIGSEHGWEFMYAEIREEGVRSLFVCPNCGAEKEEISRGEILFIYFKSPLYGDIPERGNE
jgi:hypothetical protein